MTISQLTVASEKCGRGRRDAVQVGAECLAQTDIEQDDAAAGAFASGIFHNTRETLTRFVDNASGKKLENPVERVGEVEEESGDKVGDGTEELGMDSHWHADEKDSEGASREHHGSVCGFVSIFCEQKRA